MNSRTIVPLTVISLITGSFVYTAIAVCYKNVNDAICLKNNQHIEVIVPEGQNPPLACEGQVVTMTIVGDHIGPTVAEISPGQQGKVGTMPGGMCWFHGAYYCEDTEETHFVDGWTWGRRVDPYSATCYYI